MQFYPCLWCPKCKSVRSSLWWCFGHGDVPRLCSLDCFPPLFSLKFAFSPCKPGKPTMLTVVLSDTAIFTFYFLYFQLTFYHWKSVAMTTRSCWGAGVFSTVCVAVTVILCESAWMQTGSQTARQLSLLNPLITTRGGWTEINKINYRVCVLLIKNKKKTKSQSGAKIKVVKLLVEPICMKSSSFWQVIHKQSSEE